MQIIYTSVKKRKPKKPTEKQRQLAAEWEKTIQKYTKNKSSKVSKTNSDALVYSLGEPARRETPNYPSLPFTGAPCYKKQSNVYTGTKIKGIGTMHKSNAVPIFSDEEAQDIAKMRR